MDDNSEPEHLIKPREHDPANKRSEGRLASGVQNATVEG
jgi:hypothetical protein